MEGHGLEKSVQWSGVDGAQVYVPGFLILWVFVLSKQRLCAIGNIKWIDIPFPQVSRRARLPCWTSQALRP